MTEKRVKLFSEFEPTSTRLWEEIIHNDLKGKDYERSLISKTYEGIPIKPYYRSEDINDLNHLNSAPGRSPFVRGTDTKGNNWKIREDILLDDLLQANKKAPEVLEKGVTSLGFTFSNCPKIDKKGMALLLTGLPLDKVEINFSYRCGGATLALLFAQYIAEAEIDPSSVSGTAGCDPIGTWALKGKLLPEAFINLTGAIKQLEAMPGFRAVAINGRYFANSGASAVQELAFSLSQGVEYITRLTSLGLNIDEIATNLKFNFGIGGNYFMEIAKLRAARLLWAQIINGYNPKNRQSAMLISHSETNTLNKTLYDPYVNMLRTQTEAMSAALGGTGSISITPFNAVTGSSDDFSRRIARNQQILLKEEAHLDKVVDPAAGSYYIEALTASLARHSWDLFLKTEEAGGFMAAFRSGIVQKEIKDVAAQRNKNVASRRDTLLGTNQFPNFTEVMDKELPDSIFQPSDYSIENSDVETLKPYRLSQPFEALRYKTDQYAGENGRPIAFMLTIGDLTMRKARAQFSSNFFAVAGFEVIDNNGFNSIKEGVESARAKNAKIIVLCSDDDTYRELAPEAQKLLNRELLVIAGDPKCRPELESAGINNYIHVKSNALEELKLYQEKLEIN